MFSNVRNSSNKGNLVEFKAGRCKLEPGSGSSKRNVVAEKEKGLVFIRQSSDQLMHLCWSSRESGALVDDLIIFPGDTEFKEVGGCSDGRVFMLKFKSSEERRLFWLQESSLEVDVVRKVNDALNKPPPPRPSGRERNTTGGGLSNIGAGEAGFQELGSLARLDHNQLMRLIQMMHPGGRSEFPANNLLRNDLMNAEPNQNEETTERESQAVLPAEHQPQDTSTDEANKSGEKPSSDDCGKPDDEMELD